MLNIKTLFVARHFTWSSDSGSQAQCGSASLLQSWSCEMSGSSEKATPVDLICRQDRVLVLLNVLLKRTLQNLGFFSFINLSRPQQLTAGSRDQVLTLWSGSTDSKALDYQRTNPRKYQMVRTHRKETT